MDEPPLSYLGMWDGCVFIIKIEEMGFSNLLYVFYVIGLYADILKRAQAYGSI